MLTILARFVGAYTPESWTLLHNICSALNGCVPVFFCLYVSVSLCLYLPVSLYFCFYVSLCLFVSVSMCLCASLSLCLCVSVSVSLCLCVSVSLSVSLSLYGLILATVDLSFAHVRACVCHARAHARDTLDVLIVTTKLNVPNAFFLGTQSAGMFFILAAHEHYTLDVLMGFYIATRTFQSYHTVANSDGGCTYTRVAVCCSVLQCAAVCCSVLQCVAV